MEPHHHFIDKLAFFNGIISGIALYPQVYSVFVHGAVAGLSYATYTMILINSIVWMLYAVHRGLISLGIASLLNSVASGMIMFLMFIHS